MTSAASWNLTHPSSLAAEDQSAIRELALTVEDLDGAEPLNEHTLLHLAEAAGGPLTHVLASRPASTTPTVSPGGAVVGYAQVEPAQVEPASAEVQVEPASAEVLVGPLADRDERVDLAADLIAAAEDLNRGSALLVWARGRTPIADAARRRGYTEDRVMLTMRRPLAGLDGSDARLLSRPDDVHIRAFVPGQDDDTWLAVNAVAFATHPEQGRWTRADLAERLAQAWFDPAGFLLAEERPTGGGPGTLLGYHWTKLHPPARAGEPPVAEVYVLGISPSAQGRGLGGLLLEAGLRHLAAGPALDVILYVEETNTAAVGLYQRDGFVIDRRDVRYRSPAAAE